MYTFKSNNMKDATGPPPPYESVDPHPNKTSPHPGKISSVCAIQFSASDKIRLHAIPDLTIPPLRKAILSSWDKGIQGEKYVYGAYQFKLEGNPWTGSGHEGVNARSLLAAILKCMAQQGWALLASVDPTRKNNDKQDIMFFEPAQPEPNPQLFAISFNRTDRIRLIDPPESWLKDKFKEIVTMGWSDGIQHFENYCGSFEAKLRGNPWRTSDARESIAAKLFLCHVIAGFRRSGYKLYASVGITEGDTADGLDAAGDCDVWVFRKVTEVWN